MTQDLEDNWYWLLKEMQKGRVIPIVGPELAEIDDDNTAKVLYERAARELGARYLPAGTTDAFGGCWGLHACVAAILGAGNVNVEKLRRAAAKVITSIGADCALPLPLDQLAAIDAFDVYVSITSDSLLFRSLKQHDVAAETYAFGIRSDTASRSLDIPLRPRGKVCYQLLGSAENELDFALHEGDVLEYLYRLQSEHTRTIKNLIGRLRGDNLLFIGCHLPDWFGRSLLRVVNEDPLLTKAKQEFMTDFEGDSSLSLFVARFSPNSLCFPGSPREFVSDLATRWNGRTPIAPTSGPIATRSRNAPVAGGRTVFISYASENSDAARAMAERLLQLGAGDVWLDKKKLRGGDDWSENIGEAIRSCDYFLPVLSSEADARGEGVYWEEWATALERARRVADAFILPTLIDADPVRPDAYMRIGKRHGTARFLELHLLRAPRGTFDVQAEDDLAALFQEPVGGDP